MKNNIILDDKDIITLKKGCLLKEKFSLPKWSVKLNKLLNSIKREKEEKTLTMPQITKF